MPPRRVSKFSKVQAIKNAPNDTQESSLNPAAPAPSLPSTGRVRRVHSRVTVSLILSYSGGNISYRYKAKEVKDVHQEPQEGTPVPAPPLPSRPSTGRGRRTRSRVPVSLSYLPYAESFPNDFYYSQACR